MNNNDFLQQANQQVINNQQALAQQQFYSLKYLQGLTQNNELSEKPYDYRHIRYIIYFLPVATLLLLWLI